jgi:hypothetical protein
VSNNADTSSNKRDKEWVREKEFEQDDIVVIVSKLPLKIPRYSMEITFRTPFGERKIGRHLQVRIERKDGKAKVIPLPVRTLFKLIQDAEKYIEEQEQNDMYEFMKWKEEMEKKGKASNPPNSDDEVLIGKRDRSS